MFKDIKNEYQYSGTILVFGTPNWHLKYRLSQSHREVYKTIYLQKAKRLKYRGKTIPPAFLYHLASILSTSTFSRRPSGLIDKRAWFKPTVSTRCNGSNPENVFFHFPFFSLSSFLLDRSLFFLVFSQFLVPHDAFEITMKYCHWDLVGKT